MAKKVYKEWAEFFTQILEKFKATRGFKNLTAAQREIELVLNFSEGTAATWRYGNRRPRPEHLIQLAQFFLKEISGCDQEWLRKLYLTTNHLDHFEDAREKFFGPRRLSLWEHTELQGVDLSKTYIQRQELERWSQLLCTAESGVFILTGTAGTGKTSLIEMILLRQEIRKRYQDGFLWAELGPDEVEADLKVVEILQEWCLLLEIPLESHDYQKPYRLRNKLKREVVRKNLSLLIVIDDLWWWTKKTRCLSISGLTVVVTTRKQNLYLDVRIDKERSIMLGDMHEDEALMLIRAGMSKYWTEDMTKKALQFAQLVQCHPLSLAIGTSLALEWGDIDYLLRRLQDRIGLIRTLNAADHKRRDNSLEITLGLSFDTLDEKSRGLIYYLANAHYSNVIFDEDLRIAYTNLKLLHGGDTYTWEDACRNLERKTLLLRENDRHRLHLTVAQYAVEQSLSSEINTDTQIHIAIQHLYYLNLMSYGPPQHQSPIMLTKWDNIEQTFERICNLELVIKPPLDPVKLTLEFGRLGCQVLSRNQQWAQSAQWATIALHRIPAKRHNLADRDIEIIEIMLLWLIDGLIQEKYVERALRLIQNAETDVWVQNNQSWMLRYTVRKLRCMYLQDDPDNLARVFTELSREADSLAYTVTVLEDLAYAEAQCARGDFESENSPDIFQVEVRWWEAAKIFAEITNNINNNRYGVDWWWVEKMIARIVTLRAKHSLWQESIALSIQWLKLRQILQLPTADFIAQIASWIMHTDQQVYLDWLAQEIEEMEKPSNFLLVGLKLADQGKKEEAISQFDLASRRVKEGDLLPKFSADSSLSRYAPLVGDEFDGWVDALLTNLSRTSGSLKPRDNQISNVTERFLNDLPNLFEQFDYSKRVRQHINASLQDFEN